MFRALVATIAVVLAAMPAGAQLAADPVLPAVTGNVGPDAAAAADARAEARRREAAEDRAADQRRAEDKARDAAEDRADDARRQAIKERQASEARIAAEQRATAAEAERARSVRQATAKPAAPAASDARAAATEICMAEAKARGRAHGVTAVTLREVEDTDKLSDGRASVRASVNVVSTSASGRASTRRRTIKCDTRHGVVTKFRVS